MRKAVVDVGSNSVLLTVFEDGVAVLETTAMTALGAGTRESGVLSETAMQDTLAALRHAFEAADTPHIVALATMAARIARNTPEFLARCAAQGTPVEVLSGEREAELGFLAAAQDALFAHEERVSIIDVGGHSTEIATADRRPDGWSVRFRRSYPIGTLALRGGVLAEERPPISAVLQAVTEMDDAIGLAYRPGTCGTVVSLGATGTNLVSIREGLATWSPDRVHGATLLYEEVSRAAGWLCGLSDAERAAVVGMEPGRERTMHLGALILERFLFALRAEECRVSIRGWRYAV